MPGYKPALNETVPSRQRCGVCGEILRNPVQTIDGDRKCRSCCSCRHEQGFTDRAFAREEEYLSLRIKCSNSIYGCPWEGQLRLLKAHCDFCLFTPVECPYDGCNAVHEPSHLYRHRLACPFRPVLCDCGREMPERERRHHVEHCPEYGTRYYNPEVLQFPYIEQLQEATSELVVGRLPLYGTSHYHVPVQEQGRTEGELVLARHRPLQRALPASVNHLLQAVQSARRLESLPQQPPHPFNRQDNTAEETTEMVAVHRAIHHAHTEHLLREVQNARLEQRLSRLEQILRDLEQQTRQLADRLLTLVYDQQRIEERVAQLERKITELERLSTHGGSFQVLWKIPNISRRRRDAAEGRVTSIYSPPFYTGRYGYKMCMRVYLNGDGIGYKTHLSIFIVLMKGEYDALLKWPFGSMVSLILVDHKHKNNVIRTFKPTQDSSSFQQPVADMNVASGCPQFAPVSVLEDENYVKEDVLSIKCIIRISHQ